MADALNEKLAKGPDNVMEFTMERLLVSIAWDILSTFNNGIVPTARSGNSSENAVYLVVKPNRNRIMIMLQPKCKIKIWQCLPINLDVQHFIFNESK